MVAYTALLIILVIVILAGIYIYFRHRARKKALKDQYGHFPSHTELYFEEYFEDMIDSWDLVQREEAQQWVEKMDGRLNDLSHRLDSLKSKKGDINQKLDVVENRIEKVEAEEGKR